MGVGEVGRHEHCAFRAGSPERDDQRAWSRLMGTVAQGEPFYCHQGMHVSGDGTYVPVETDGSGRPVGYPVCAGWRAARTRHIERSQA